jgi:hypothetical protein
MVLPSSFRSCLRHLRKYTRAVVAFPKLVKFASMKKYILWYYAASDTLNSFYKGWVYKNMAEFFSKFKNDLRTCSGWFLSQFLYLSSFVFVTIFSHHFFHFFLHFSLYLFHVIQIFNICNILNIWNKFCMDWNKNILRTIQPETDHFFKNALAGHEKRGYYKTNRVYFNLIFEFHEMLSHRVSAVTKLKTTKKTPKILTYNIKI